jgi:hypothetical protein
VHLAKGWLQLTLNPGYCTARRIEYLSFGIDFRDLILEILGTPDSDRQLEQNKYLLDIEAQFSIGGLALAGLGASSSWVSKAKYE